MIPLYPPSQTLKGNVPKYPLKHRFHQSAGFGESCLNRGAVAFADSNEECKVTPSMGDSMYVQDRLAPPRIS